MSYTILAELPVSECSLTMSYTTLAELTVNACSLTMGYATHDELTVSHATSEKVALTLRLLICRFVYIYLKAYFFWSLLAFTGEHRESEFHWQVITVMRTTIRQWAIVLPNRTINVSLLNIHAQGSLYKYRKIKPPCITCTKQTSSRHRACVATRGMLCVCPGMWMAQLQKLWPKMMEKSNTLIKKVHLSKISINNAENILTNDSPKFTRFIPGHSLNFPRSEAG